MKNNIEQPKGGCVPGLWKNQARGFLRIDSRTLRTTVVRVRTDVAVIWLLGRATSEMDDGSFG